MVLVDQTGLNSLYTWTICASAGIDGGNGEGYKGKVIKEEYFYKDKAT